MIQPHKSSWEENKYKTYGNLQGEAALFDGILFKENHILRMHSVLRNTNHKSHSACVWYES